MADCELIEVSPGVFQCPVCKAKVKSVANGGKIRKRCPKGTDTPPRAPIECVHRGEATGEVHACELCSAHGEKIVVYSCDVKGECILTRWTNSKRKLQEAGETCCVSCADRTRADGSKPMAEFLAASPQASVPS